MSTAALFDEESSEDDGDEMEKAVAVSKQDDNDDDDDDKPAAAALAATKNAKKTIFDDESDLDEEQPAKKPPVEYNDNDDDEEMDDDDGIVGTAAAERFAKPTSKPKHMTVLPAPPLHYNSMHMTKLPNIVGTQSVPFDPDLYNAKEEEQDYKGFVHTMIRWRHATDEDGNYVRNADGKVQKESNARIVKWQDDSVTPPMTYYTLHVGAQEVLELDLHDSSQPNGFAGLNGYIYLSQQAQMMMGDDNDTGDDAGTTGGTVLECVGAVTSRMTARPVSLQSEAHKNLTVAVRQKTIKKARIAEYVTQEDPEKAKEEKIKIKSDLEKATSRKRSGGGGGGFRKPGMNKKYLEDDGNYDSINIKQLKKRGREEDMDSEDYGDSDDESEDEVDYKSRVAAMKKRKAQAGSESDEDLTFGAGDDDNDDDSEDGKVNVVKKAAKKRATVLDDDDDDSDDDE
jgi:RNA polymerase-associated protein LEO1